MRFDQKWTGYAIVDGEYSEGFAVCVPGNIQKDYADHMGWGDVNYMDNCRKYLDIEDYFWSYKTDIEYTKNEGERVFFVTHGIEYEYDVKLNGKLLTHHEGMFTKVELDITDELACGNGLEILIYPHPKREGAPTDRALADQSCKPAVEYGWDWHPRVLLSGLWDETYIEARTASFIRDAELRYTLSDDFTEAKVRFEIDCDTDVKIELRDMDGKVIYSGSDREFTVENPKLWWCNGQGEAYLYSWKVTSADSERCGRVGFKRAKLIMHEGAWKNPTNSPKSRSNPPITLELNGRVVFVKGSNWVNPEIFTASIAPDTYITQVDYAKEANMNLLRCWGGAIVYDEVFYDRCDEQGIMIWQEFQMSCNNHEGTPHYLATLEQEATAIIKRIRRHASHVLWCGGNELFNAWSGMTEQSHALRLLDKLTYENDFEKPYIMTSPLSGMGHGHYDFWHRKFKVTSFELYANSSCTAYPEFGTPSIASMDKLLEIFTDSVAHDPSNTDLWTLRHGFEAFEKQGWAGFDNLDLIFGKQTCMEDYTEKSNLIQCESLKFIFEECRRQKPVCSMALNWCYNEPWVTAAGSSIITYPSVRKPAYYHVANALRPVLPSARIKDHFVYKPGDIFEAQLWLLNDTYESVSDTVEAYITVDGEKKHIMTWNTGASEPNKNICGHSIRFEIPDTKTQLITLTLEASCGVSEYRVLLRNDPPEERVLYAPKLGRGDAMEKDYIKLNTVSSKDQLKDSMYVKTVIRENAALKVLFVGNSITRHGVKEDIGWFWDHGMAASSEDKDYVHRTVAMLEEKYGPVSFCIAQLATWERDYWHTDEIMEQYYKPARDFAADIVIMRLGENIRDDDYRRINVKDHYEEMIKFLGSKNPAARIVVTDNFWKRKPLPETGRTINDEFFDVAKENGYIFCRLGDLSDDESTMAIGLFEHHGVSVHPGDYGMEMIAKRIFEVIPEIK